MIGIDDITSNHVRHALAFKWLPRAHHHTCNHIELFSP